MQDEYSIRRVRHWRQRPKHLNFLKCIQLDTDARQLGQTWKGQLQQHKMYSQDIKTERCSKQDARKQTEDAINISQVTISFVTVNRSDILAVSWLVAGCAYTRSVIYAVFSCITVSDLISLLINSWQTAFDRCMVLAHDYLNTTDCCKKVTLIFIIYIYLPPPMLQI